MYSRCIRCNRSFQANSEIENLPVGRRLAFDTTKGRLWVVCTHCEQWNLVPIEERWEAVEQCDRLAASAEATATGSSLGIAQTATGLELLRVGGLSRTDIANWRYGGRLVKRQQLLMWTVATFAVLAVALGVRAGVAAGSAGIGVYAAVAALAWLAYVWKHPPRLSTLVIGVAGRRVWIWPWQIRDIVIDSSDETCGPRLAIPGHRERFEGAEAAQLLAELLPKINGAECATASVRAAVAKVAEAERETHAHTASVRRKKPHKHAPNETRRVLRPWERLVNTGGYVSLDRMRPESRLALEIAVTEELEQQDLIADAESARKNWVEHEAIAEISDSLLVPPEIEQRLRELRDEDKNSSTVRRDQT